MTTQTGEFLAGKRIVVAGAGIAGLAFVAAFHQLWDPSLKRPEITVFEQNDRKGSLQQDPYMLTINGGSQDEGLVALQQLGLLSDALTHATLNSGVIRVWSDDWKQLATLNPKPYGDLPAATMRMTRENLKRILLVQAERSNAVWNWECTCTAAERLGNGEIQVTISNVKAGSTLTQTCDILIAADGADSKIRGSFRPDDMKLQYVGATQIGGISRFPGGLPHPIHEDYGLQMSSGEGVCCVYTPFDKETIGWALSRLGPERKARNGPVSPEEFAALKSEALKTAPMFNEPFKSVIDATDPPTTFVRPAKEKQPFLHDAHLRGVVFIGDANHVLNSYVLTGANSALKDGWDLAEQFCRKGSLEGAVAAYDKLSVPRFEHDMKFSHERIGFGHSTGLKWKVYKYGMAAQRAMAKK